MSWLEWATAAIASWTVLSFPAALVAARLLREPGPFDQLPTIADEDRLPLPPALRDANRVPSGR